ncbi:Rieske (2Fe-2S) protein [Roseomonas elaeocarpi]|uniref:Rieske (2Fe-2S) protein n=1 Tax=Roseomonas elaeocarpi TaxID=907779 RepID=A0ABV6JM93_9PROT
MSEAISARPPAARRYVVARKDDIAEGDRLIVEVAGREIGIYHVNGAFYALLNRCPHLGGPLCHGQVVTEVTAAVPGEVRGNPDKVYATCPWHNWEFDIRTGQSYWNPKGLRARPFNVALEAGESLREALESGSAERVPGPYAAETIPVAVEDEYLVLSLRPVREQPPMPVGAPAGCVPPSTTSLEKTSR